MSISVYNTLSGEKEDFVPREPGKVGIYVCGVTPYDEDHLGHARPSIFWDVVRRFFRSRGYDVRFIQNFTDVDDKIINRAQTLGEPALELARRYSEEYLAHLRALGVEPGQVYPRVSEHIPQIIALIQRLVEKGHAYAAEGNVYFSVKTFPEYGKLSGRTPEELMVGARVEPGADKRDPLDFALWKKAKPGEPSWDSPWGPGR
ncbi:MAG: class I tRNA ligase family protein, partial [Firmicutes bacterium]|nr:class I tRNA ligase family protein [Bacillota bacterium]